MTDPVARITSRKDTQMVSCLIGGWKRVRRGCAPSPRILPLALAAGACAVALGACGGGGGAGHKFATGLPSSSQRKGGTIKLLAPESFEHLDPGESYFQLDYEVVYDVQRPLYSFRPDKPPTDPSQPVPDVAAGPPQISKDRKTVTVKIKPNIRYSPGTVNRPVESQDIKYAFERGLNASVANGYEPTYFSSLVGFAAAARAGDGRTIPGIRTPDRRTVVFKLTKPQAPIVARALVLPLSAPVPREYAARFDRGKVSTYDSDPTRQAFTGPYVIKRYTAGKGMVEERNAAWSAATDYRKAYPDRIEWSLGVDANVAGRQILQGRSLLSGDSPPAPIVKRAVQTRPSQISFTPLGNRYVTLNTHARPFSDENLRKAVGAILDREQMRTVRGGAVIGDVATHFVPPGVSGFEQAGGLAGPGFDWLRSPSGDARLAAHYMKQAGYPSGKYTGPPILVLGDNSSPAKEDAQVVQSALQQLGFTVNLQLVEESVFYSKFCNVTAQLKKIAVCASYGWVPDFPDPETVLDPTFNGENVVPVNNANAPLLNVPAINRAMDTAATILDRARRAAAWAAIDRTVTGTAAAIPWLWDREPNVTSKNVVGVIQQWNGAFQPSFCSLRS
jgi:peptide/nickel transport system substrate-binding protein